MKKGVVPALMSVVALVVAVGGPVVGGIVAWRRRHLKRDAVGGIFVGMATAMLSVAGLQWLDDEMQGSSAGLR